MIQPLYPVDITTYRSITNYVFSYLYELVIQKLAKFNSYFTLNYMSKILQFYKCSKESKVDLESA